MKSIQPGITEIAGYRILGLIGTGGMGNVYRACHAGLNREAAIKILHQPDMAARFRNEAYIQSSVNHPNIARLYEYLPLPETPCIIMEYVQGQSLDQLLQHKGRLAAEQAENIIAQVAAALACLHAKDIVHRDIKPSNFKIQADGTVKMLDFGISKNKYTPRLTQQGYIVGTAQYMAPEQFYQQAEKKTDLWSLGVMAYELTTGYLPFEDNNVPALQTKISRGVYTPPSVLCPGISTALQYFISNSLRVNAMSRITAQQTLQLFGKKKTGTQQPGQPVLLTGPQMLAAAFVLAGFILLAAFIHTRQPGQDEPEKSNTGSAAGAAATATVKINTPSIENASIVFPDGVRRPLPYEITGKKGQSIEFTISANGYTDKKVQVEINDRRSSYEYNLEKINE